MRNIPTFFKLILLVTLFTACNGTSQTVIPSITPTLTLPLPTNTLTVRPTRTKSPTRTPTNTPDLTTLGEPEVPIPFTAFIPLGYLDYDEENFFLYQRMIHGRQVTIAWEKTFLVDEDIRQNISDTYFEAFITWWDVFGGFPYTNYSVIYRADRASKIQFECGLGFGGYYRSSVNWYLQQNTDAFNHFRGELGHAVFHGWDRDAIRMSSNADYWILEGITMYYGDRFAGQEAYQLWMNEHRNFYIDDYLGTACDVSLVDIGLRRDYETPCDYSYMTYQKGALVSYLIDKRLIQSGLSMDDLLRDLYISNYYGYYSTSNNDVLVSLNRITGEDWTQFFDDYIYGTTKLPLEGIFIYREP